MAICQQPLEKHRDVWGECFARCELTLLRALSVFMLMLFVAFAGSACSGRPDIAAVQQFYRQGTPHTDRQGINRKDYDSARSFLPIAIYHALSGTHHGVEYDLRALSAAGFNTVHLWERQAPEAFISGARDAGLQAIVHWPKLKSVENLFRDPTVLAWYLDEEPTFLYPPEETQQRLASFRRNRDAIRRIDKYSPIFVLDGPPTEVNRARWNRWNRAGDITSHFNYPVTVKSLRDYGPVERVAKTTAIARDLVDGARPVWIVLQAFGGEARGWRMPRPATLRAMAYAAIVHGATGLVYFAYDSFVTRDDGILGISPSPRRDYGVTIDYNADDKPPLRVSETELDQSRKLFRAVAKMNAEMTQLREAILSPTSAVAYSVRPVDALGRGNAVRTLLKRTRNGHFLFAVNVDGSPAPAVFRFSRAVAEIEPLFGSAVPENVGTDGWTMRFPSEAVGVYRVVFKS